MPIIARVASSRQDPPCSHVTCSRAAVHSDSESTSTPSRSNITAAIGSSVLPSGSAGFRCEATAGQPSALGGQRGLIKCSAGIPAPVLDRAAREPRLACSAYRLGYVGGLVGEAVLQISRDRQLGCSDERLGVRERLLAAHGVIEPTERGRMAAAGARQRLKAERCEQACRAWVPGIGEQQRLLLPVQRHKAGGQRVLLFMFGCSPAHLPDPFGRRPYNGARSAISWPSRGSQRASRATALRR